MNEEQEFLVEAQRARDAQVMGQGGQASYEPDPAIQEAIDDAVQNSTVEPGSMEPGFMGMGGLSKSDVEAQERDIAERARNVTA
ncbi:MAG TPA: hypothetical protein VHJ78_04690 [Actinomycetota bacterium]|nr:hypothetical protein [Actinomycetota bacterium]